MHVLRALRHRWLSACCVGARTGLLFVSATAAVVVLLVRNKRLAARAARAQMNVQHNWMFAATAVEQSGASTVRATRAPESCCVRCSATRLRQWPSSRGCALFSRLTVVRSPCHPSPLVQATKAAADAAAPHYAGVSTAEIAQAQARTHAQAPPADYKVRARIQSRAAAWRGVPPRHRTVWSH